MDDITAEEIETRIREIVDYGEIRFSDHVSRKMSERNYNIRDIIHILRNGKILKFDALVKSLKTPYSVIPVKTGIQLFQSVP